MKIGTFFKDKEGVMHGKIYGLGLGVTNVVLEQQTSLTGKPYFKIIADPIGEAYEIGAAFPKEKDGMAYHSVSLESPALAAPLNAALFQDKATAGHYNLVWGRPEPKAMTNQYNLGLDKAEQQAPKAETTAKNVNGKGRRHASPTVTP